METCNDPLSLHEELKKLYISVDENGDGILSPDEINALLQRLGMERIPLQELCDMMSNFSKTKHGHLTMEEFAEFYKSVCDSENDEKEMLEAFKVYDLDGDGYISAAEIHKVLSSLGFAEGRLVSDCQSMIEPYDTNMDGLIDFSEFKSMMMVASPFKLSVGVKS